MNSDRPIALRQWIALILVLAVLAGGLRFFRLGAWSFGNDETATLYEGRALFQPEALYLGPAQMDYALAGQIASLPRIIPLGYVVNQLDYALFGEDEFGTRVMMAVLGTLSVVVVFIGPSPRD